MKRECESCIKRKTPYCPTSIECMATDDMPYYQNRIMLLEENQELKNQLEEHKKKYIYKVNNFLAENVESDPKDLYMAELEQRAMDCELMEMQQKEFIKYLENRLDICDGFLDTIKSDLQEIPYGVISANENITTRIKENETAHKVYEEILQKYRSIIGVSDENKTNV